MNLGLLDSVSIFGVYIIIIIYMLLAIEGGFLIGARSQHQYDEESKSSIRPVIGSLLGMLAFVLAFTFSMSADNHKMRKQNVLEEANIIEYVYLRADLLPDELQYEVKTLLKEYTDIRINAVTNNQYTEALKRTEELHRLLWEKAITLSKNKAEIKSNLFVNAVNRLIEIHNKRLEVGLYYRISESIWIALLLISTLAMIVLGIQHGLARKRNLIIIFPLCMAYGALISLVIDLDRPQQGLIKVGSQSMQSVQKKINDDLER